VGTKDGGREGLAVGDAEGVVVDLDEGTLVGLVVGDAEGERGEREGLQVGALVGFDDGTNVLGLEVGKMVG